MSQSQCGGPSSQNPYPSSAAKLYRKAHAGLTDHRALISLSEAYSRAEGRLDTRYSPVRRSPSVPTGGRDHAAPRLACVRPVASVHPEPGSNSSL